MEQTNAVALEDISQFIQATSRQLSELIDNIGLDGNQLFTQDKIVSCPINANHRLPYSALENHTRQCILKAHGFYNQNQMPTSKFFYQSNSSVSSIMTEYSNVKFDKIMVDESHDFSSIIINEMSKDSSVIYPNDAVNIKSSTQLLSHVSIEHENASSEIDKETVPIEKIRKIYAWQIIPQNYTSIDVSNLNNNVIKSWIIENLPKSNYLQSVTGSEVKVINIIIRNLYNQALCQPNKLVQTLWFALESKGQQFVIELWKFLWTTLVCYQYNLNQNEVNKVVKDAKTQLQNNSKTQNDINQNSYRLYFDKEVIDSDHVDLLNCALSPDRMTCVFTPEQRFAIYEDINKRARAMNPNIKMTLEDLQIDYETIQDLCNKDTDKNKTHLEVLAEQRDYKRRRQTYRAKNVHITKRTPTQIHRDLIELQMKYLESMIEDSNHRNSKSTNDSNYEEKRETSNIAEKISDKRSNSVNEQSALKSWEVDIKSDRHQRRHDNKDEHHSRSHRSRSREKARSHSKSNDKDSGHHHHHRRGKDNSHRQRHRHKHKKSHKK